MGFSSANSMMMGMQRLISRRAQSTWAAASAGTKPTSKITASPQSQSPAAAVSVWRWLRDRLNEEAPSSSAIAQRRDPTLIQRADTADLVRRVRILSAASFVTATPATWLWQSMQRRTLLLRDAAAAVPDQADQLVIAGDAGAGDSPLAQYLMATERLPNALIDAVEPLVARWMVRADPLAAADVLAHTGGVLLVSTAVYAVILYATSCFAREIRMPDPALVPADLQHAYRLLLQVPPSSNSGTNKDKASAVPSTALITDTTTLNQAMQQFRLPVPKRDVQQLMDWLYGTQSLRVTMLAWHGLWTREHQLPMRAVEKVLPGIQSGQRLLANTRAAYTNESDKRKKPRMLYFWLDWDQLQVDRPRVWYALHCMLPWAVYPRPGQSADDPRP